MHADVGFHAVRDDALGTHDLVSLRAALAAGEVGADEVAAAAQARADASQAVLNAVVTWTPDQRLRDTGPFAGVPSAVKDNEDLAGYPTTHGSRATPRTPAPGTSDFVRDFQALGFGVVGKTALPEFGLTATTEPLAHGPARNPWNLQHSTGGSSGGSAALVAAGVVPIAHANDGGGSIRIPAACCGLVGLKPTNGRLAAIERMAQLPIKIATQGVLTRTVRDTVEFYREMESVYRNPALPSLSGVAGPARAPLRIGVITGGLGGTPVDPEVAAAVVAAGELCERMGHRVTPIDFPFDLQIGRDFLRYWAFLAFVLERLGKQAFGPDYRPSELEDFTFGLSRYFRRVAERVPGSVLRMRRFAAGYDQYFADYDLLLSPVLTHPAPELGYIGPEVAFDTHLVRLLRYASFTAIQNISGAPAISLPMAVSSGGLPIGVQFSAPHGQDATLLEIGLACEEALVWPSPAP